MLEAVQYPSCVSWQAYMVDKHIPWTVAFDQPKIRKCGKALPVRVILPDAVHPGERLPRWMAAIPKAWLPRAALEAAGIIGHKMVGFGHAAAAAR